MGGYLLAALTAGGALWGGALRGGTAAVSAATISARPGDPGLGAQADELMGRFFDESLDPGERTAALKPLGGLAKQWLDEATPPLSADDVPEARVISGIVQFFAEHSGRWIAPEALDGFYGAWFDFVEGDRAQGGAFAESAFANELGAWAVYLIARGSFGTYLSLLGEDGRYSIHVFPESMRALQLTLRANVYRTLGHFDLALRDMKSSELLAMDLGWREQVRAISGRVRLEIDLGRLDRAAAALARADSVVDEHIQEVGIPGKMERSLQRATFLLATGDNELAAAAADHALNDFQRLLSSSASDLALIDQARATRLLGQARFLLRRETESSTLRAKLEEARELLGGHERRAFSRALLRLTATDLLQALGLNGEALAELDSLSEEVVRMSQSNGDQGSRRPGPHSFPLLEMRIESRRYEIRRSLGETERGAPVLRAAFSRLLDAWRGIAVLPGGVGFLEFPDRRRALELVIDSIYRSDAASAVDALALLLEADACSSLARQLQAPAVTPEELMSFCAAENTILVYVIPTEWSTYRFTVSGAEVTLAQLEGAPEFQLRLKSVLESLRQRPGEAEAWPTDAVANQLGWLGKRLVPESPGSEQLVYVGTEGFGICPVEVLPDAAGSPIGLTREVVRLPALNALLTLRDQAERHRAKPRPQLRVFALSGVRHSLDPIDLRLAEDRELRDDSGADVRFTAGKAATSQGFREALSSGADLFVAWTHGAMSESLNPGRGLVVLDPDTQSRLGTQVIESGFVKEALDSAPDGSAPLVALIAACHLNQGPRRTGDTGAGTFVGRLMASGVPAVIAGSESLDREASMQFVLGFSKAFLGEGATVGAAALAARQRVADSPGMNHPHFWSPLQVTGYGNLKLPLAPDQATKRKGR